jgi:coiled-coil domain-containing protein 12
VLTRSLRRHQQGVVFRMYQPRDGSMQALRLPQPTPVDAELLLSKFNALDLFAVDDELLDDSVQLSLAPKNPNWDLKRELQKQLQVLEQQTQKAIIELMRDKLARHAGQLNADAAEDTNDVNFNEAIDAQARRAEADVDSDDDGAD